MADEMNLAPGSMEPASSDERDAIIKVIDEESSAWLKGDFEAWKAHWVQDDRAQHVNARPFLGARVLYGFDEIQRYFEPVFQSLAGERRPDRELRRENWRISVGADMAWATFDQYMPVETNTLVASGLHNQMRILERVQGAWKIVAVFQVPNRYGYYSSPWVRVDAHCRVIDRGPGLDEALARRCPVVIVGTRLCGHGPAETRKLRDAVEMADALVRKRRARSPIPLILNDPDGVPFPPCWITIADMMVILLLHDRQLLSNAVSRAGQMFGLSPMQVRVAEEIARGHDLSEIAATLNIRPSTVRTHVRRMFGSLNVNSQTALVRTLLTASPP